MAEYDRIIDIVGNLTLTTIDLDVNLTREIDLLTNVLATVSITGSLVDFILLVGSSNSVESDDVD